MPDFVIKKNKPSLQLFARFRTDWSPVCNKNAVFFLGGGFSLYRQFDHMAAEPSPELMDPTPPL